MIIAHAEAAMAKAGAVVLSDYAKGVLTVPARRVDDGADHGFAGDRRSERSRLSCLSRRHLDHAERQGTCRRGASPRSQRGAEIAAAAAELAHMVESEAVLVTRSEEGMSLHVEGQPPIHIPAYPVKVRDVSGAGDTVAAVMAVLAACPTSRLRGWCAARRNWPRHPGDRPSR